MPEPAQKGTERQLTAQPAITIQPLQEQSNVGATLAVEQTKVTRRAERTAKRKVRMLEALRKANGVVSMAAPLAGVERRAHYKWLDADPEYKAKVDEVEQERLDMAEATVLKHIIQDDLKAAMYYLDSKGKNRGYGQKPDVAVQVNTAISNQPSGPIYEIKKMLRDAAEREKEAKAKKV